MSSVARSPVGSVESLHEVRGRHGEASGSVLDVAGASDLGGVSDVPVASGLGSGSHDSGVDSAGDAVGLLEVELGEVEVLLVVGIVVLEVFAGGLINDLLHGESLDGLVLGVDSAAVGAVDDVGVSLVLLGSSVVSSLGGHVK